MSVETTEPIGLTNELWRNISRFVGLKVLNGGDVEVRPCAVDKRLSVLVGVK